MLGVSDDEASPEIDVSLESFLKKYINVLTLEIAKITTNYCILAQIRHLESEYVGEQQELMSIYDIKETDYHVYDDEGKKISNKPCDINTHWLMIVSKQISKQIVIGQDFRICNNLKHQIQPNAPIWFRPK